MYVTYFRLYNKNIIKYNQLNTDKKYNQINIDHI